MCFEYDTIKSSSNKEKHGISFSEAQLLWEDNKRIEIRAKTIDEERFLVVGKIEEIHWSAVITYRERNIRLISVRRARKMEIALYEST